MTQSTVRFETRRQKNSLIVLVNSVNDESVVTESLRGRVMSLGLFKIFRDTVP